MSIECLIDYRPADAMDVVPMVNLYNQEAGGHQVYANVFDSVDSYPSSIAVAGNRLVGFAYCREVAPDILELWNLYVAASFRNRQIGSNLLTMVEKQASTSYKKIMVVNSLLYPYEGSEPKRSAEHFYARHGYSLIDATAATKLFSKPLNSSV